MAEWELPPTGWDSGSTDATSMSLSTEIRICCFSFVLITNLLEHRLLYFISFSCSTSWEIDWPSTEEMKSHDKGKKNENSLLSSKASDGRR